MEKLDQFHIHAALHTACLAIMFVENNLRSCPVYYSNQFDDFNSAIDNAIENLYNAHQAAWRISAGDEK